MISVAIPMLSMIYPFLVIGYRFSVIGRGMALTEIRSVCPALETEKIFGCRLSVVGYRLSVVGYRLSVVGSRVVISPVSMAAMRLVSATSFDAPSADMAPTLTAM